MIELVPNASLPRQKGMIRNIYIENIYTGVTRYKDLNDITGWKGGQKQPNQYFVIKRQFGHSQGCI